MINHPESLFSNDEDHCQNGKNDIRLTRSGGSQGPSKGLLDICPQCVHSANSMRLFLNMTFALSAHLHQFLKFALSAHLHQVLKFALLVRTTRARIISISLKGYILISIYIYALG